MIMKQVAKSLRKWLRPLSPRPRIHQLHQLMCRRPIRYDLPYSIASVTFDDFPRSALLNGGRLLRQFGACGTYYTSLGLMGTDIVSQGPCFTREDLDALVADGHELGCHTYAHVGARQEGLAIFEAEIRKNREEMAKILPGYVLENFAYPGGEVTLRLKRRMRDHAVSSRGCYAGINRGWIDLDLLLCQHLRMDRPLAEIRKVVDSCISQPGWLIFYVHDVSDKPSVGGCTPEYMEAALEIITQSCRILTVAGALKFIRAGHGEVAAD